MDDADITQVRLEAEEALQRKRAEAAAITQAALPPTTVCLEENCGEPLPPQRIAHGFRLCVTCQTLKEKANALRK